MGIFNCFEAFFFNYLKKKRVLSIIMFSNLKKCIGGDIEKVIKLNENSHEK